MKVCLISPPTVTEFNERVITESEALRLIAQHAPMGILSLGAVLEQQGAEVELVDLNRLYYQYVSTAAYCEREVSFASYASTTLESISADVFGFSTICSTYPLTLRLAQRVRAAHPERLIVLGGPQASVVDVPTLKAFPYVDMIVRGEAEKSFPLLLDSIFSRTPNLGALNGITYRQGKEVTRNPNAPVIEDLDSLPMPAFHLYPHIKDCIYAPLEAGRGCPFACSFCSTNDFFRRRFRLKSAHVLVEQMRSIKKTYGIDTFDLIHDMFTVDRKKVVAFCDAVESSGEELYWSCSARTDCIDDELIGRMAETGCSGIYFGVDSGSERMQGIIQKRLNLSDAAARISCANKHSIRHTVSLITGFPEETRADLRSTIHFLGEALRHQHAEIQLHLLAPLAETPITTQYREQLVYDDIFSDISFQGWEQDREERAMIMAHRDIFPNFYAVPTRWLDREYLREVREFILHGILKHLWLMVLLHREGEDLLRVFDEWQAWSRQNRGPAVDNTRAYYAGDAFSYDLLRFVQSHEAALMVSHPHLLKAMADVERAQLAFNDDPAAPRSIAKRKIAIESVSAVPVLAGDTRLVLVSADYKRLMRCLKRRERFDQIPTEQVALVLSREKDQVRVIQLTNTAYELMQLCNGSRTITEIASEFSPSQLPGLSPLKASMYGLALLARKGFIDIQSAAN